MKISSILSITFLAIVAEARLGNHKSSGFLKILQDIRTTCEGVGGGCNALAGHSIPGILAAAPECLQQDLADNIVDFAKTLQGDKRKKLIASAKAYRTHEKNTKPNFKVKVDGQFEDRKSLFCQKAPRNVELNGLVQAQSPTAANVFFDPKNPVVDIKPGADPRTVPFGGAGQAAKAKKERRGTQKRRMPSLTDVNPRQHAPRHH